MNTNRKLVFTTLIILVAVIYLVRIFYLQIVTGESSRMAAENNALNKITIYPARSIIYDRNGKLIAYSANVFDLIVFPKEVKSIDTAEFCRIMEMDVTEFRKRLVQAKQNSKGRQKNNNNNNSAVFYANLSIRQYSALQENIFKFRGFYIEPKSDRQYAIKGASHILGYIGEATEKFLFSDSQGYYKPGDLVGITGLEKNYEPFLRGVKGVRTVWQDRQYKQLGDVKDGELNTDAVSGADFYASIDLELQKYAEELLNNKRGSIVAIEPSTGEILVLANKPDYDPGLLIGETRKAAFNQLLADAKKPLYNRAVKGTYPPGSTFKPVMALIGMQEGTLTPETVHYCAGGYYLGNLRVGCHPHPPSLSLRPSLGISCNAYYCHVFRDIVDNPKFKDQRIGYARLEKHLRSFGLGSKLGIDLPGESNGNVPTISVLDKRFGKNWKSGMIISLAIGQGEILLTPLQMANVAAILANRGWYYTPHLVRALGKSGNIPDRFRQKHFTTIDTQFFRPVIDGMSMVTLPGGTAWGTGIPEMDIMAKTGTAQNPHGQDHSLYIAFAPRENPKIAIAVIVENGGYGATWAAPIANLIIEKYLQKDKSKPTAVPALQQRMINSAVY